MEAFQSSGADRIVPSAAAPRWIPPRPSASSSTTREYADVRSLEGAVATKNKCVPIIAVPTTAGTAAEVTINYVITDAGEEPQVRLR